MFLLQYSMLIEKAMLQNLLLQISFKVTFTIPPVTSFWLDNVEIAKSVITVSFLLTKTSVQRGHRIFLGCKVYIYFGNIM